MHGLEIFQLELVVGSVEDDLRGSVDRAERDAAANCQVLCAAVGEMRSYSAGVVGDGKETGQKVFSHLHVSSECFS